MENSKIGTINWRDFVKSLFVAIFVTIGTYIYNSIQAGDFTFNLHDILKAGLIGMGGYLFKNLITDHKGEILIEKIFSRIFRKT